METQLNGEARCPQRAWLGLVAFAATFLYAPAPAHAQENWTQSASFTRDNLWSVTWGADRVVAVGENGAIGTSSDGRRWTPRDSGTREWLVGVAYGDNRFIAVGANGTVLTSADGVTWTRRIVATTERLNAVAHANGRWVIVGENNVVMSSLDGVIWTAPRVSYPRWLRGLHFAYGSFVATGEDGTIVTTSDGVSVSSRSVNTNVDLTGVTHGHGRFVAVGNGGLSFISNDAASWRAAPAPVALHDVAFFNNTFVAASGDGAIYTSPLGEGWVRHVTPTNAVLLAVGANPSMAVAVGFGGTIIISDAVQRAPIIAAAPANITEAAGNNVQLKVAATGTAPLAYQWSRDGVPMGGATTDTLTLRNVQSAHAGRYSVTVTNAHGAATSLPATLTIDNEFGAVGDIIDPTFTVDLPTTSSPSLIAVQGDQKIIVAGMGSLFVRLHADGSVDPSFSNLSGNPTVPIGGTPTALALQPDGKILIAGTQQPMVGSGRPAPPFFSRANADGRRDPNFASPASLGTVRHLLPLPDGRILVADDSTRLHRLNSDGAIDPTFRAAEFVATNEAGTTSPLYIIRSASGPLGEIYVVASGTRAADQYYFAPLYLARLRPDGSRDESFPLLAGGAGTPFFLRVQSDGKLLFGRKQILPLQGGFAFLFRYNPDGTPDPMFQTFTRGFGRYGGNIAAELDANGNILVVYSSYAPTSWEIHRLGADGVDSHTLTVPTTDNRFSEVSALAPLPDGRVIVAGRAGVSREFGVVRRLVATNSQPVNPPQILAPLNPAPIVVPGGSPITLSVEPGGTGPFRISWTAQADNPLNMFPNPAERDLVVDENGTLRVPAVRVTTTYIPTIRNASGSVRGPAFLVVAAPQAPVITRQPVDVSTNSGRSAVFSVDALGSGPITFEWSRVDGRPIRSFTQQDQPTLRIPSLTPDDAGLYQVTVTNALGKAVSVPVRLAIDETSRLANVSTRGFVGTGEDTLIVGFVVTGPDPKSVLVRAVGPGLAVFGVTGVLADPQLAVYDGTGRKIAENDDWTNGAQGHRTFNGRGIFALAPADSALIVQLPPGNYTAHISGKDGATGIALAEVYENASDSARLVNVSARVFVGTDAAVAIPGIIVTGTVAKRLLVRAVGPGLTRFGITRAVADPKLTLVNEAGDILASNDNWSPDPELTRAAAGAGAFPLDAGSRDAALLATVLPGNYTAIVTGADATTGIALVEVYELP